LIWITSKQKRLEKENSDTFNKVVIEMTDTGGELAKIGNEDG